MLTDKKGAKATKPIFSIEEMNLYDQHEQAHKLQITSKLASSRFLAASEAPVMGTQASVGQSSSRLFQGQAGSVDSYVQTAASPTGAGPQLPDTLQRRDRAAAASVGAQKAARPDIKPRKVTAAPPTYAQRMARAQELQAERDKEERRAQKAMRKQERQFHRMMAKLKSQQEKAFRRQMTGEKPQSSSESSEPSESEEETTTGQDEQNTASVANAGDARATQKDSGMQWSEGDDKARSLNATEPMRSLANPFENTPHGDIVANYLEEARHLQTLHLSSDVVDQGKVLQDAQSAGVPSTQQALGARFSQRYDQSKIYDESRHSGQPGRSQGQGEKGEGVAQNLAQQRSGPPIINAQTAKQIRIHGVSGSALDQEIRFGSPTQRNAGPSGRDLLAKAATGSKSGLNDGKDLEPNLLRHERSWAATQEAKASDRRLAGGISQQSDSKYLMSSPRSRPDPRLPRALHARYDSGSQTAFRGLAPNGSSSAALSPIKAGMPGPSALAMVRGPRFQRDLDVLRRSQNVPIQFKGQSDINAEFFKHCFDQAAKNYSFLLDPSRQTGRRRQVHQSVNFGESKDGLSTSSRLVLPSINHSQVLTSAYSNVSARADAQGIVKPVQQQHQSPAAKLAAPALQKLELGATAKASAIQNRLVRVEHSLSHFNSAFMKSPKLKSELIKCQQLLQFKSRFLAQQGVGHPQMGRQAQLNTRDKLKQIYNYQAAEQLAAGAQAAAHQPSERASSQAARATPSMHAAVAGELEGTGSMQDLPASPERTASRDESQENGHDKDQATQSPFMRMTGSIGPKSSAARPKEQAQKQGKARFVSFSQHEVSNPMSHERSTDSVGRGSRTSKAVAQSSPARVQQKEKKAFKSEQQLELERQQREAEAFAHFIDEYEKPRDAVADPSGQLELYKLQGVQEIIQLADHLVKYREYKADQEKERIANMPAHERRTLEMVVQAKKHPRPMTIKRTASTSPPKRMVEMAQASPVAKNQKAMPGTDEKRHTKISNQQQHARSISSMDSDQEMAGDGTERGKTAAQRAAQAKSTGKRVTREKQPDLCVVQKKALNFMHNQFKDDRRYQVDPEEEKRVRFLDLPEIEGARKHFGESQCKEFFAKVGQIDCKEHSEQEDEEVEFVQLLYGKLAAFYGDLLDERHNKVALEKLCRCFVDQIKEKNEYSFRELRKRIQNLDDLDSDSFYLKLRTLNPEMFLKAEKASEEPEAQIMQSSHKDQVEVMDAREHHQHSFNPIRQVYVNRLIFETLIQGMVDVQFGKENAQLAKPPPKSCANKLLDQNMRRREQEKERQQMLKRMSRSGTNETLGEASPTVPRSLKKMQAGLLETLSKKLEDQKHFQDQTQRAINLRQPQADLNPTASSKSKTGQVEMVEKAENVEKTTVDQNGREGSAQQQLAIQEQWSQKAAGHVQELFHKEYQKQKFYAEQKHFSKNPSLNPGSQTDFYMHLNEEEKHCLVMPYFTMIQGHTLHLRDQFLNSHIVKALAAFVEAQTAQYIKKLSLKALDVDLYEDQVEEEVKELRELKASRIMIETLSIDDCGMQDEDLALLLRAVARQGKLKYLTIANNNLGQESIAVLEKILMQQFKQPSMIEVAVAEDAEPMRVDANPFQALESLNLTNLKCSRSQCLNIATVLAETAISWPLKSIKLSGLDLNDQAIGEQLGAQFEVNPGLLRLDLSYSRMFPCQLAGFTKYLALEASNAENIKLQYLGLGYINIDNEGPEKGVADDKVAKQIVEDLCAFIASSKTLLHLDLSGMNLRERVFDILSSVHANESQTLVAIHLHDNRFTLAQKGRVLRAMGIETNDYHRLKDSLNLQEHDTIGHTILSRHYIKQGKIQNMAHKFFKGDLDSASKNKLSLLQKEKQYRLKVLNNELNQEMKESQKQIETDVQGGHSRGRTVKDPMILTRMIGQPELIFNDRPYCSAELNAANSEERWTYNDSISGDDCYVCQQYSFVQIFFNREKAGLDFQKVTEPELREILKSSYDLDRNESLQKGAPILLSSVNNWVLTRFLDVKIFSQLLKGEADEFILQSAIEQQREYKDQIERERERLAQKTKTKAQPKMAAGVQKKSDPDEEALSLLEEESSYVDTKFIDDEVQAAKDRAQNIRKCIAHRGSATFNALVGINSLQQAKPYDARDDKRAPLSSRKLKKSKGLREEVAQDEIVDRVAGREWRQILRKCQKYRKDLVSINQPPHEGADGEIFVFAGFVKPGRHVIVIFDPLVGEFFRKDVIVEVRRGEVLQQKAKRTKPLEPDEERAEDMADFAFRDWRKDDDDAIQHVLSADVNRDAFSSANMRMSRRLFFNVKELLSVVYHRLLDAYKIYLIQGNFPSSSLPKFFAFLKEINVLHTRGKASNTTKMMTEDDVLRKFYTKDPKVADELLKSHIVYRHEFVRVLFSVAYQNFKRANQESKVREGDGELRSPGEKQSNESTKAHSMRFVDYCSATVLRAIRTYIKKHGGSHSRFRHKYIWTKPVSGVLQANRDLLTRAYGKYTIQGKFTAESLLQMLREMKIALDRREGVSHEEMARRLFGSSKQTQWKEDEFYFYASLTEVEFYELIARLAAEVYHRSYADLEAGEAEKGKGVAEEDEEKPYVPSQLAAVAKDQKALLRLRLLAVEPLEQKIYELLLVEFAEGLGEVAVKDIEGAAPEESLAKKRKAVQGASLDQLRKLKAAADAALEEEGQPIKISGEGSSDEFAGEEGVGASSGDPGRGALSTIQENPG